MFDDPDAYTKFARMIRKTDRFGQSAEAKSFIAEFIAQLDSRAVVLPIGRVLFRAANDCEEFEHEGQFDIRACGENRMFPTAKFALEGRVNPSGIVVLYMATTLQTAVSEVRPWVGDLISVVRIELLKECRIADLSKLQPSYQKFAFQKFASKAFGQTLPPEVRNSVVWSAIDDAFSRPVSRSEAGAEYAPTQILAGAVRFAGFDGLAYKSSFGGEEGYNVALFGTECAELVSGHLHKIDGIDLQNKEAGNAWFRSKSK